jgi:hypothetical protein
MNVFPKRLIWRRTEKMMKLTIRRYLEKEHNTLKMTIKKR